MNSKTSNIFSVIFLLPVFLIFSLPTNADIVSGSHWVVKSGDSVYGIARNVYPNDTKMQARFRKELVKANPNIFKGNANLMSVGSQLKLPAFAVSKPQLKPKPKPVKVAKPVPEKKPAPKKALIAKKSEPKIKTPPKDIIGKVVINLGELKAENNGQTRSLKRNSKILKGDTIKTAKRTYTQIRLEDGALLSLRPETEFHIVEYNYNGKEDGTERGIFELIKGGFRTITGAIGHRNKQNYKVKTAVATIGIRGTHYGLMLCSAGSCQNNDSDNLSDGLYGGVIDGSVMINNNSGQHSFNNDQYFHLASANKAPVEQLKPPPVFHGQADQPAHKDEKQPGQGSRPEQMMGQSKEQNKRPFAGTGFMPPPPHEGPKPPIVNTSDDGTQPFTQPVAQNQAPIGSAGLIAFNQHDTQTSVRGVSAPIIVAPNNNSLLLLEKLPSQATDIPFLGHMEEWSPELQRFIKYDLKIDPSQFATNFTESNTDTASLDVVWGRWDAPFYAAKDGKQSVLAGNNLHMIYSANTTTPAQRGGLVGTATYNYVDGTIPTEYNRITSTVTEGNVASIDMVVDFGAQRINNYTVDVQVVSNRYNAEANFIPFTNLNRNFQLSGATLCTGCEGEASVVFVGSNAKGAMTSYSINQANTDLTVSGAALLTKP